MNTSSINGLSANYIQSTLADQLASGSLTNSSSKNAKSSQESPFSKMLSDATSGASSSTNGSNASHLLSQLVGNYQVSGVQNQGQSLDPMSIGA